MNNKLYEITEKLKQILFNPQPLQEMSRAFAYKNRSIEVCVWVEGPMGADNRYFKYYNSLYYNTASKVARIRIDRPEYVGGNHKEHGIKQWKLSSGDKQELEEILKGPSDNHKGLTRWQDILITYNEDNFNISADKTINGILDDSQRNPKINKNIKPFPIDYPMPSYEEL